MMIKNIVHELLSVKNLVHADTTLCAKYAYFSKFSMQQSHNVYN